MWSYSKLQYLQYIVLNQNTKIRKRAFKISHFYHAISHCLRWIHHHNSGFLSNDNTFILQRLNVYWKPVTTTTCNISNNTYFMNGMRVYSDDRYDWTTLLLSCSTIGFETASRYVNFVVKHLPAEEYNESRQISPINNILNYFHWINLYLKFLCF